MKNLISVLFTRRNSIYNTIAICDVWDEQRDARTWPGGNPIIAHPPCSTWGQLAYLAKPNIEAHALAPWAIDQVRRWGGVLEHPFRSSLWPELNLPAAGKFDSAGGWTLPIHQHDFGHRAQKKTLLYIVGCRPENLPRPPIELSEPSHVVGQSKTSLDVAQRPRRQLSQAGKESTPPGLAHWLVQIALQCRPHSAGLQ